MDCHGLGDFVTDREPAIVVSVECLEADGAAATGDQTVAVNAKLPEECSGFRSSDELHG